MWCEVTLMCIYFRWWTKKLPICQISRYDHPHAIKQPIRSRHLLMLTNKRPPLHHTYIMAANLSSDQNHLGSGAWAVMWCIWGCCALNDDLILIWSTCPVILLERGPLFEFQKQIFTKVLHWGDTHSEFQNQTFHIYSKESLVVSSIGFSHQKTNVVSISSFPEYKWRQFVQFICLFLNPWVSPHSGTGGNFCWLF